MRVERPFFTSLKWFWQLLNGFVRRWNDFGNCWNGFVSCWNGFVSCWTDFVSCWNGFVSCWTHFVSCWIHFVRCWTHLVSCWIHFVRCWTRFVSCWTGFVSCQTHFVGCWTRFVSCGTHSVRCWIPFVSCWEGFGLTSSASETLAGRVTERFITPYPRLLNLAAFSNLSTFRTFSFFSIPSSTEAVTISVNSRSFPVRLRESIYRTYLTFSVIDRLTKTVISEQIFHRIHPPSRISWCS